MAARASHQQAPEGVHDRGREGADAPVIPGGRESNGGSARLSLLRTVEPKVMAQGDERCVKFGGDCTSASCMPFILGIQCRRYST